ncbi:hypothetical protein GEMRC1_011323 [Eukaryota sp. GEM-RC1]
MWYSFAISGEVHSDKLTVMTANRLAAEFNLQMNINTECTAVDISSKEVTVKPSDGSNITTKPYDILFLSVGCSSFVPPIPGHDLPNVFSIRSLTDLEHIKPVAEQSKSCTIIGGGFVGLECAESLTGMGIKVTIVELLDQLMGPLTRIMLDMLYPRVKERC